MNNYGKFSINAGLKTAPTVKDIYRRGCQLARVGYDPRTTLNPADSARFIHHTNARIADLAHYSVNGKSEDPLNCARFHLDNIRKGIYTRSYAEDRIRLLYRHNTDYCF